MCVVQAAEAATDNNNNNNGDGDGGSDEMDAVMISIDDADPRQEPELYERHIATADNSPAVNQLLVTAADLAGVITCHHGNDDADDDRLTSHDDAEHPDSGRSRGSPADPGRSRGSEAGPDNVDNDLGATGSRQSKSSGDPTEIGLAGRSRGSSTGPDNVDNDLGATHSRRSRSSADPDEVDSRHSSRIRFTLFLRIQKNVMIFTFFEVPFQRKRKNAKT